MDACSEENVKPVAMVHEPVPTIRADRGQMRRLLTNLIANVIKYCRLDAASLVEVSAITCAGELAFFVLTRPPNTFLSRKGQLGWAPARSKR